MGEELSKREIRREDKGGLNNLQYITSYTNVLVATHRILPVTLLCHACSLR